MLTITFLLQNENVTPRTHQLADSKLFDEEHKYRKGELVVCNTLVKSENGNSMRIESRRCPIYVGSFVIAGRRLFQCEHSGYMEQVHVFESNMECIEWTPKIENLNRIIKREFGTYEEEHGNA